MRKRNRIVLTLVLCLCMLLEISALCFASGAEHFSDVSESYWAYPSIQALEKAGMLDNIIGADSTSFSPRSCVSRLEFAEMLVESLFPGANTEKAHTEEWELREREIAETYGLIDNEASLTESITRQEAAHLLAAALDIRGENMAVLRQNIGVTDIDTVDPDFRSDVIKVYNAGLFVGCGNSKFNPAQYLYRDEEAVLIQRLNDASCRVPAKGDFAFDNFMFLGDSLFSNPHYSSDIFARNGHQVFAGGGAVAANFLGLTSRSVTVGSIGAMTGTLKDKSFNGIVILLGANDLGIREPSEVIGTYRQLVDELLAFTDKPIFVLKVFPVNSDLNPSYGDAQTRIRRANEFNDLLSQYCSAADGVWLADATGPFTDSDGYLTKCASDGLHISSVYYDEFYSAIETALYNTGVLIKP